MESELDIERTQ